MSIEGLGRKFQEARKARNLSLEEAARLTRIRQSRLAEIEADDFSNFPSLAYAKGFLQIYGKFLEVDVSPYLDAFETSGHLTVDGYSYLQDSPAPKAPRTPVVTPIRKYPALAASFPDWSDDSGGGFLVPAFYLEFTADYTAPVRNSGQRYPEPDRRPRLWRRGRYRLNRPLGWRRLLHQ